MAISVYEVVTERIIAALEKGVVPWRMPWRTQGGSNMPRNLQSGKDYRGVNILLLGCMGFSDPRWCSYKQAGAKGGQVRKGEKSTPVIFWKVLDKKGGKPGEKSFILRYYNVFNVSQCDWAEPLPSLTGDAPAPTFDPIEECERIVLSYKTIPAIDHGGSRACYMPTFDRVCMPAKESFGKREEYYSTLFHELTHSTGHESRLNRDGIMNPIRFGSHDYSFEELVAECGAAFLCAQAGIIDHTLDNSVAYIQNWAKKLKSEPKWIVEAASKAAKAADYIFPPPAVKEEESEEEAA